MQQIQTMTIWHRYPPLPKKIKIFYTSKNEQIKIKYKIQFSNLKKESKLKI